MPDAKKRDMTSPTRITRLKHWMAFVADQVLQFWPAYRMEIEDEEARPPVIPIRGRHRPEAAAANHAEQLTADPPARRQIRR